MADEETPKEETLKGVRPEYFDLADPDIRTVYANRATVFIGDTDISMFFGVDVQARDREYGKISTRVVMSHAQFLRFVELLAPRFEVLATMYQNAPPSLDLIAQLDPERARDAWQKLSKSVGSGAHSADAPEGAENAVSEDVPASEVK